jgi:succinate-semialdehyde dehydrogenase
MDTQTIIAELIQKAKFAQSIVENYTQEQIDVLVKTIGKTIHDNAEILAEEAVNETGYGLVESKTWKQRKSCIAAWCYLKEKKSVGIIETDSINKITIYAKPIGVVACVTPSTNPTSTMASNGMHIVKARNAMIIAPHPKAKKCTVHGVNLLNHELKKVGAPDNLIQVIEEPSMPLTQELMSRADVVVATGGFGMIKAAYSSGKPSYGVGQGNVQAIIAKDYSDLEYAAATVVNNRSYDNGMPCTCEQSVFIPSINADGLLEAMKKAGAYLIDNKDKIDVLCSLMFKENGTIDPAHVGMTAVKLAEEIGIKVPEGTKILLVKSRGKGREDLLCKEKLCPVLQYYVYDDLADALEIAKTNLLMEGAGHTSTVFTNDITVAQMVGETLPVGRVVVNQSGSTASGGNLINGLSPTMSLGCGSWGNNSISENLTYRHLMNYTRVAYLKENIKFPSADEAWSEEYPSFLEC